jgi:type IV secretory pathway VirB10-like protein
MFNRIGLRPSSECLLYLGTWAAVIVAVVTAVTAMNFALRSGTDATRPQSAETGVALCAESGPFVPLGCRDKPADQRRTIRTISTDRVERSGLESGAAPVTPATPADQTEPPPAVQPATPVEHSAVSQPPAAEAEPVAPAAAPREDAEVRPRKGRASARQRGRQERSFTGARRSFDAVH